MAFQNGKIEGEVVAVVPAQGKRKEVARPASW